MIWPRRRYGTLRSPPGRCRARCRPRRAERRPCAPSIAEHSWQRARNLRAIDPVVAGVRRSVTSELELATRHRIANDLRQLAHAVVLVGSSDVEGFGVDRIAGRLERGDEGAADVFDVHDRPPWRAVALDQHLAGCDRMRVRLLSTMSQRSRGETPYAVALRSSTGVNRPEPGRAGRLRRAPWRCRTA